MIIDLERRGFAIELRASGRRLGGLAAPFDQPADLGGGVTEIIRPGAFAKTLASKSDVLLLADHDTRALLARTGNGSLRLWESTLGLEFEAEVIPTSAGNDALALAGAGAAGGMSFGFKVEPAGEVWRGQRRELREVELREISLIAAWPAYAGTRVEARALMHPSVRAAEAFLAVERGRR